MLVIKNIKETMKVLVKAGLLVGAAAMCGIMIVAGELDDSPGLSGLGLLGLIGLTIWTYKKLNSK